MELFLTIEALKDVGASKVTVVVPYLAYSRQDRRFLDGEAVSVKTILNIIYRLGGSTLIVVEPHHLESLDYFPGELRVADRSLPWRKR